MYIVMQKEGQDYIEYALVSKVEEVTAFFEYYEEKRFISEEELLTAKQQFSEWNDSNPKELDPKMILVDDDHQSESSFFIVYKLPENDFEFVLDIISKNIGYSCSENFLNLGTGEFLVKKKEEITRDDFIKKHVQKAIEEDQVVGLQIEDLVNFPESSDSKFSVNHQSTLVREEFDFIYRDEIDNVPHEKNISSEFVLFPILVRELSNKYLMEELDRLI